MKLHCGICIILVHIFLTIKTSGNRYCLEAIKSVKYVPSCPSSKIEWDAAAQKKNCSRIAFHQNCSTVEKFQYHCVINGYRNKMMEVCAPSRIIFGHCVEFNLLGGVIQDQYVSHCNNIFPKCDIHYDSSTAYKYPDCYKLISRSGVIYSTIDKLTATTTVKYNETSTTTDDSFFREPVVIVGITAFAVLLIVTTAFVFHKYIRNKPSTEIV